jgi:hypothetical protein
MRSSFTNDIVPVAVSDTAAGARAVLQDEREKNQIGSVDYVPDTLGFTVRKKDGRLLAEFYVVEVPKWGRPGVEWFDGLRRGGKKAPFDKLLQIVSTPDL